MLGWHFVIMMLGGGRGAAYGRREPFQLHTIIFLSSDLLVPGGDTFFLSPAMMCQMPHLRP